MLFVDFGKSNVIVHISHMYTYEFVLQQQSFKVDTTF